MFALLWAASHRERGRGDAARAPPAHTRAAGRGGSRRFYDALFPLSPLFRPRILCLPSTEQKTTHTPLSPSQRARRAPVSLPVLRPRMSGNTREVFSEINQRAQARFARWDAKAPSHLQPQHQQPLSRHWIGGDLSRPAAVASQGRRGTDVRESLPGCTLHHANKGFEKFQRFSHGTLDLIHARHAMKPVEEVMYDPPHHSPTRMPVQREGDASTANEPCFYLGDQPPPPSAARRPAYLADTRPRRDDWRLVTPTASLWTAHFSSSSSSSSSGNHGSTAGSLSKSRRCSCRSPRPPHPPHPPRPAERLLRRRRQPPRAQGQALG